LPRLAPLGDWFGDLFFPDLFRLGGGCRIALLVAEKQGGLVDEDSDQPAFEGAFAAESWRVAGGCEAAVSYCLFGFFNAVEDAAGDEMEQLAGVRELQVEGVLFDLPVYFVFFVQTGLAVGLAAAADNGNVEMLGAFLGSGKELRGDGYHKHVSVLQSV
jgi:hypothetical protein